MNILPVNNSSNSSSFAGLWSKVADKNTGLQYLYYPFKNETKENLSSLAKGKNFIKNAINVMKELPFNAQEYALYLKTRLPITRDRRINNVVINKNLSALA